MNTVAISTLAAALLLSLAPTNAGAQPKASAPGALRPFCPDRPTKGTSACTVDRGRWQVEADIVSASLQRSDGVRTESWLFANPTIKYGVTNRLDVEVNLPLLRTERTRDKTTRSTSRRTGVGDLTLAAKYALTGNSGDDLAVVIQPFVQLPTARRGLGGEAVEAGARLPISAQLAAGWSLNITPEARIIDDETGDGRHLQASSSVGVSHGLGGGFNGSAELWAQRDFDPSGDGDEASVDFGLGWTPKRAPDLQLDVGVNLGLTRQTPEAEVYAGVARRF